jgi:(R,R)-butanediol dehydrogenase/meso-butanediol dehydrogenase/diacetyl reductase
LTRAAVFHAAGSPLSIEKVPDPHPAAGEVLIEVARAGICEACDEGAHARP